MKRVTTILKEIDKLEHELYRNYTEKEIYDALNKLEEDGYKFSLTSLLNVIYTSVESYLMLDEEFPDED